MAAGVSVDVSFLGAKSGIERVFKNWFYLLTQEFHFGDLYSEKIRYVGKDLAPRISIAASGQ